MPHGVLKGGAGTVRQIRITRVIRVIDLAESIIESDMRELSAEEDSAIKDRIEGKIHGVKEALVLLKHELDINAESTADED